MIYLKILLFCLVSRSCGCPQCYITVDVIANISFLLYGSRAYHGFVLGFLFLIFFSFGMSCPQLVLVFAVAAAAVYMGACALFVWG